MQQPPARKKPLSLDDVAQIVEQHCGMNPQDAHDLLEDVLTEVGHLLQDIETARERETLHVPPAIEVDVPEALPYTEEWDPDFDPRKGLLLLRPDGQTPRRPKS